MAGIWNYELPVDVKQSNLAKENKDRKDDYEGEFKANSGDVALIVYVV